MFEALISLLLFGAVFGIVYLLCLLATLIDAQLSARYKAARQGLSQQPQRNAVQCNAQRRAIQLLYGDRDTAHRLAETVRVNHPYANEQWVWGKVVFDLERDRER